MSGKPDWQFHPPSGMRYYKFKLKGQLGYRFEDGRSLTQSEFDRLPDYREQQIAPRSMPEAPAPQDSANTQPTRDAGQAEDTGRSAFPEQELGSPALPNYFVAPRSTSTHQESRRHGSTYSTEKSEAANASLSPALSSLSAAFARIRMGSYRELHSFVVKNPDIVSHTESDPLIVEARAQERIGNQTDAQTLIHHALLLRRCIDLHPEQYGSLFQRLEDKYGDERRDFATRVKVVYETIKSQARAAAQQPHLGSSENQVRDVPLMLQSKTHIDRHDTTQPFRDRELSHSIEAEARSRYEGAREYTPALDASIKSRRVQDQDGKVAYRDAKGHLLFPERSRKDPDRHPQNTDQNREKGYRHQENSGRNWEGGKRHRGDIDRRRGDIDRHRGDIDRHREDIDRHEEDDEVARMNDEMTHLSVRKSNSEVRVQGDMPIGSEANSRTPKGKNRSSKAPHPHRRPSVSSAGPMPPLHQGKVRKGRDINNTDGEVEILDPRYVKRNDAKTFFTRGRVFSLMWYEPAGENNTSISKPIKMTRDRFGGEIFSHILRMVVVKGQHGACLCVPVHTYGGRGVSKPGFSRADREAHSIIYMSDTHPRKLPEETDMNKKPIAVDKASADQKLDEMSRINFSRVHTVIWNVRVMNVGMVSRESMPSLVSYWKQALE